MGRLIKRFSDNSLLEFYSGRFDSWCVYLTRPDGAQHPPRDDEYFTTIQQYAGKYSAEVIYRDFVAIYDATGKAIEVDVLKLIESLSQTYAEDVLELEIIFTILYASMVAEENKANTRLGKRVKRLGLHQILFDGFSPSRAANFSKGMRWRDIAAECRERGF